MKKHNLSFSLIEVVIFVGVLSLFFLGAMMMVTFSVKNTKTSENKIVATQYAKELFSWLKAQKESDWNEFLTHTGKIYCFNNQTITGWPEGNTSCNFSLGGFFKREARITNENNEKVKVEITVKWSEGNNIFTVPITGVFTRWE